jgi:FKBP-type peptidyl-prolyl cis-trans isomerase 2
MFEGVDQLEVGMQFHASAPDGQMQIVTIRDMDGDDVTVDGNHPLAGQRLNFQVKVVACVTPARKKSLMATSMVKVAITTDFLR